MTGRRLTRAQRVLIALHGTTIEFAERAMRLIGTVLTSDEAIAAVRKYRSEFEAAGNPAKENADAHPHQDPLPVDQDRK